MRQCPGAVIVDVADEAKLATWFDDARHRGHRGVLHETPLPVPALRPGIGMDQIDPRHRSRRRPCQQFGGVAGVEPDIADVVGLDLRQDFCHAVDIGLAADEPDIGKRLRFGDQMFAAAESDFQPDSVRLRLEDVGEIIRRGGADIQRQMRQQIVDQVGLMDAELVALAAAEERAVRMRDAAVLRRRIAIADIAGEAVIAASGTAGAAAARAARSRRCTSARNGYARPCRRPRGHRALRCEAR